MRRFGSKIFARRPMNLENRAWGLKTLPHSGPGAFNWSFQPLHSFPSATIRGKRALLFKQGMWSFFFHTTWSVWSMVKYADMWVRSSKQWVWCKVKAGGEHMGRISRYKERSKKMGLFHGTSCSKPLSVNRRKRFWYAWMLHWKLCSTYPSKSTSGQQERSGDDQAMALSVVCFGCPLSLYKNSLVIKKLTYSSHARSFLVVLEHPTQSLLR